MSDVSVMLFEQTLQVAAMSLEETQGKLADVVDRFTWETGSDQDRAEIASLEQSAAIKRSIINYCNEQNK